MGLGLLDSAPRKKVPAGCDIGLAGASAVASATVQRPAQRCLGRGGWTPLLRGLAVVRCYGLLYWMYSDPCRGP